MGCIIKSVMSLDLTEKLRREQKPEGVAGGGPDAV